MKVAKFVPIASNRNFVVVPITIIAEGGFQNVRVAGYSPNLQNPKRLVKLLMDED